MAGKRRPGERLSAISGDSFHSQRCGERVVSGCVCVPSDRSQKNINGGRSEDLGERRIGVYACDCCVNQSLRSEVPTSKRKMGEIACTWFVEFKECVIDPPRNVAKKSARREAEMLPKGAFEITRTQ